jgi:photosystem II stability/assembly factor-like uncharacterized protein
MKAAAAGSGSRVTGDRLQPPGRLRRLKGMRIRLLALACLSVVVAGCGTSTLQAAGGQTKSAATTSVSPAAGPRTTGASAAASSGHAGTSPGTGTASAGCGKTQAAAIAAGTLTGLEFVSPAQGWAVGQDVILATSDGGAHWTTQRSGPLNLTSVDFVSAQDGWAVGTTSLLGTTDGGAHWTSLPEPCQAIRSVHFISPTAGFAVAGGDETAGADPALPVTGGVVLTTSDGGRTWHPLTAPANAQTVCFSDASHGWLGADGLLYRTTDGGRNWTALTSMAGQAGSDASPAEMSVECANDGSAWALRAGPDAGMSQNAHVGYHADASGATPIFAEQYFQTPGGKPTAESPGSEAGPFSAIDSSSAAFIDWCPACGYGTAPWDIATNSGATLTTEGNVGSITEPQAASFQSARAGWVAGSYTVFPTTAQGTTKTQERIVATTDDGRTWHVEWSGPWSSS